MDLGARSIFKVTKFHGQSRHFRGAGQHLLWPRPFFVGKVNVMALSTKISAHEHNDLAHEHNDLAHEHFDLAHEYLDLAHKNLS